LDAVLKVLTTVGMAVPLIPVLGEHGYLDTGTVGNIVLMIVALKKISCGRFYMEVLVATNDV
jgi:hypothetical protein